MQSHSTLFSSSTGLLIGTHSLISNLENSIRKSISACNKIPNESSCCENRSVPFSDVVFLLHVVLEFLHSIDLLLLEACLALPGVVHVRPSFPLDQILHLQFVSFHSLFVLIESLIWITIFLHIVDSRLATRCCENKLQ